MEHEQLLEISSRPAFELLGAVFSHISDDPLEPRWAVDLATMEDGDRSRGRTAFACRNKSHAHGTVTGGLYVSLSEGTHTTRRRGAVPRQNVC